MFSYSKVFTASSRYLNFFRSWYLELEIEAGTICSFLALFRAISFLSFSDFVSFSFNLAISFAWLCVRSCLQRSSIFYSSCQLSQSSFAGLGWELSLVSLLFQLFNLILMHFLLLWWWQLQTWRFFNFTLHGVNACVALLVLEILKCPIQGLIPCLTVHPALKEL